ncbi:MAG: TIGR00266 family protein [Anaerolineae bacterium]|jgi:uncharacterized protein (TIGR00266 family)
MDVQVQHRPSYALATAQLEPNESIQVEAGSMVGMSTGVQVETKARGGLLKSLARSMLGGESFFINTYRAPREGGSVMLAPALPGDIVVRALEGETLLVQSGSYVASSENVDVSTQWGGAKTFFAREGLILLKLSGTGTLVLSSYGAIDEMELGAGESFTIDTGHLVAFSDRIGFDVRRVGGLKSTLFSGEGLVVDLTGPGRFWLQTRSEDAFLTWLIPKIPKREASD